jgi:uncharacterized membrane protein
VSSSTPDTVVTVNSAIATSASPLRRLSVLAGFLAALSCVFGTASAPAATTWDFTSLNTNGVYFATAINNKGDVVGSAFSGAPLRQRGFIRRNGVVTLLDFIDPPFAGGSYVLRTPFSSAADVNEAGKVVGISSNGLQSRNPSGGQHAVVWDPFGSSASTPFDLGAYSYNAPGKEPCNTSVGNDLDCYTQGAAINESNDVAGHGEYKIQQSVEEGSGAGWMLIPFLIPEGDRPLTTAEGDGGAADMLFWDVGGGHKLNSFRASGVNDNGQVVVWPDPQTPTNQNSSAIYTENGGPGTAVSLPFNAGGSNVYHAINNSGWVIGSDSSSPPQRGRLWKAGPTVELPPLPGDTESFASAINNKGDVVGTSRKSGDNCWRAVLWPHADHSAPVDLTEQTTSGWQLYEAHAINDRGQVVGAGFDNQTCPGALTFKPYLVTPPALLSVADTTVKQPLSGTATAHFTVSLGAPLDDPVSVDYETVEGSGVTGAKSPTNYTHTEGELNFAPGETSQNVDVTVKAAGPGPDKTFHLDISNPVGTSIEDERGTATIQSESPLRVTVTAKPGKVDIKQTRDGPVPVDVEVDVAVKNLGDVPVDTVELPEKLTLGWDGPAPVQGFPVTQTKLSPGARQLGTIAPGETKHGKYVLRVTADGKLTLDALVLGDAGGQTVPGFGTGKLSSDTQVLALSADMGAQVRSLTQPGMITAGTPFLVNVTLENRSFYRRILIDPIYAELEGNASDGHLQERDVLPTASSPTGSLDEVLPSQYLVLPPGDRREYVAVVRTSASDSFEDEGGGGGTRATVSFEPPIVSSLSDTNEVTELPSDRVAVTAGSTPFAVSIDDAAPPVAPFNYVDAALYVGKGSIWGLWRFTWGTFRGVVWDLPSLAVRSALNVPSATFNAIDRTVQLWRALEKDPVAKAQYINAVADRTATVFEEAPWLIAGAPNALFNAASNAVGTRMTNLSKEWEAGDWRGALTEFSAGSTQGVGEVALLLGPGVLARFPAAAARWQTTKAALYLKASQKLATVLKKAESAKVALSALRGIVKPGMAFTQKHMTRLFGVGAKESTRIAIYAKAKKLSIVLRSRAAQSIKFIESGKAVLKPYWIKTKNVSHIDAEFLGYYADDIGKVVIRRPLKRAAVEKALAKRGVKKGSPRYVEVIERHDTRIEEYATEFREMAKWDEAKSVKGKWPWEDNGVDPRLQADETSRYGFRLVHDKARNQYVPEIKIKNRWKFITGDIDLIAITKANGRHLSEAEHVAVLKDLRRLMGAQHPESATWIKGGKFWFAAKRSYLRNDGECCLAQYGPDGKIRAVEFNEKLSDPQNWKPKNYRIIWRGGYQTGPGQ